jgi:hypothetical protein
LTEVFILGCVVWVLGALLGDRSQVRAQAQVEKPQVEEIYILRSVRESRIATPTEFCAQAKTSFDSYIEDQYTLRSTATRASDGRMVDTNAGTIGSLHGCFGRTSDPATLNFYAEGLLGRTAFKGIGECRLKSNFPEPGINLARCFLDLSGLPAAYVGGMLTTNSLNSRKLAGMETDPGGYTQVSIVTVRLWKKRTER